MKFSFAASVVAFVVMFAAVAVLYPVLSGVGFLTWLQHAATAILSSGKPRVSSHPSSWFSASRVFGYTAMLGAVSIVLIPALSTLGAIIYNRIAHVLGGIEVTLRETD